MVPLAHAEITIRVYNQVLLTLKGTKREDALLLRKFGIQFKGDLAVGNLDSKVQHVEGTIAR
ncbi:hypothetical protein CTI12_AA448610 [Artemisia annua]|uniref:Uncharacterized protein n=1 Tax=Artemisia annua TaxID=35608 RepID=A0A2U1LW07_ARTAN|nr:hypothetical protein CTI12_AA448610 [Artemisia annua]